MANFYLEKIDATKSGKKITSNPDIFLMLGV